MKLFFVKYTLKHRKFCDELIIGIGEWRGLTSKAMVTRITGMCVCACV